MINFDYYTWNIVCEGIFIQNKNSLNKHLQQYPFTIITDNEKEILKSEKFFNNYIKNGALFKNKLSFDFPNHYIQKNNSSFRNTKLLSPIVFIYLECIGYHVSKLYNRESVNTRCYYAGDMQALDFQYKTSYDSYYADINESSLRYKYFYKFDVSSFFDNIDFTILFKQINKHSNIVDARAALIYKRLLQSIGNGKYPTVENSCALSFLATVVYLDLFDVKLETFLSNVQEVEDFQMVRYVDDLFIFFNTKDDLINQVATSIKTFVIHNYREINLNINEHKSNYGLSENVSEELITALYDHYVNDVGIDILSFFDENNVILFIDKLNELAKEKSHNHDLYKKMKEEVFNILDVKYSSEEIFRFLIYKKELLFRDASVINKLKILISEDYKIIKYDIRNLISMVLNTGDGDLIRILLKEIFKNDYLDSFDIAIILNYLVLRNFQHADLLQRLLQYEPYIFKYINMYCKQSFLESLLDEENNSYLNLIQNNEYNFNNDLKVWYIYFMYCHYEGSNDMLEAFSYYKSYFDRITAHLMLYKGVESNTDIPNYKKYHKEKSIIVAYEKIEFNNSITDIEDLIKEAHKLRNQNPINHSSAEAISNDTLNTDELESNILALETLLEEGFKGSIKKSNI